MRPFTVDASSNPLMGERRARYLGRERRRYSRISLHWIVELSRAGGTLSLRTQTRDISPKGFYCIVPHPVQPGERFECYIAVPTHGSSRSSDAAYLRCRVEALRVEAGPGGSDYGVACKIEEYRVVYASAGHAKGHPALLLAPFRLSD